MIKRLQERRDIQGHDAAHDIRDGEDHEGDIHREAGVVEEGIEDDTDAFATIDEAEGVEGDDEEERCCAVQSCCEDGKDSEEQRSEDLKGEFSEGILQEESLDAVGVVVVFAVEDCFFIGIDGHVLQHADEVEGAEFLEEAEARLHAVVVAFQGREEEGEADGVAEDLRCARDDGGWVAPEVDEAAVQEDGEGDAEGGHAAGEAAEFGWGGDVGGGFFQGFLFGAVPFED